MTGQPLAAGGTATATGGIWLRWLRDPQMDVVGWASRGHGVFSSGAGTITYTPGEDAHDSDGLGAVGCGGFSNGGDGQQRLRRIAVWFELDVCADVVQGDRG